MVEGDYFRALGIPLLRGQGEWTYATGRTRARVAVVNETLARRYFGGAGSGRPPGMGRRGAQRGHHRRRRRRHPAPRARGPASPGALRPLGPVPARRDDRRGARNRRPRDPGAGAQGPGLRARPDQPITRPRDAARSCFPARSRPDGCRSCCSGGFAALALRARRRRRLRRRGVRGRPPHERDRDPHRLGRDREHSAADHPRFPVSVSPRSACCSGAPAPGTWGGCSTGELYEVSPHDPRTLVTAAAVLLCVAWMACEIPARRATRTDPVNVLRSE